MISLPRILTVCLLIATFSIPNDLYAQGHVVSAADLQKQVQAASNVRQHNLETVRDFVSSDTAQKALKSAHMDPTQVKTAVSSLSDEELSQMASKVDKTQADFAAGRLSDRDLILVLIGIAALILIIVAVR